MSWTGVGISRTAVPSREPISAIPPSAPKSRGHAGGCEAGQASRAARSVSINVRPNQSAQRVVRANSRASMRKTRKSAAWAGMSRRPQEAKGETRKCGAKDAGHKSRNCCGSTRARKCSKRAGVHPLPGTGARRHNPAASPRGHAVGSTSNWRGNWRTEATYPMYAGYVSASKQPMPLKSAARRAF